MIIWPNRGLPKKKSEWQKEGQAGRLPLFLQLHIPVLIEAWIASLPRGVNIPLTGERANSPHYALRFRGASVAGARIRECNFRQSPRFQNPMKIEIDMAVKPARRLRKLLRKIPSDLPPDYVHKVRTQSRKLEATVHAISSTHNRRACRLLKGVKPIRKAAGSVRDMDVMIVKVLSVAKEIENNRGGTALLRLTEQMSAVRERNANELRRLLERRGDSLSRKLKAYAKRVRRSHPGEFADSMAMPKILAVQLQHWPRLKAGNLHDFRIQAKELRYMLQLAPKIDQHMLDAFARVKDIAGEWHDWLQLHEYAGKVLDNKEDLEILRRLGNIEHEKLKAALGAANSVRHNGLAAI